VQQEQVDVVDAQAVHAGAQALRHLALELLRLGVGQLHLGRDEHAVGDPAAQRLADDQLRVARAVRGRDVDHRDARVQRRPHGGDRLGSEPMPRT
jgi:hypothetical protein